MADSFAFLGQERRPWLEAELVKEAFHRRSAELHPDVPGTGDAAKFAELNAAYLVLREPASRLRHLLELAAPEALARNVPPPAELGELFMKIGAIQRRSTLLAEQQTATASPLARALLAGEEAAVRRELSAVRAHLALSSAVAAEEVRALDASWSVTEAAVAAALYQRLAYLARWTAQVDEAALRWER